MESAIVFEWDEAGFCSHPLYNVPPQCIQDGSSLLIEYTKKKKKNAAEENLHSLNHYFRIFSEHFSYLPHVSYNWCISPRMFNIYTHFSIWIRDQCKRFVKPPARKTPTSFRESVWSKSIKGLVFFAYLS